MLLTQETVERERFERETGWALKPEGACKGDLCIPLSGDAGGLDLETLAERLGMGLVRDERFGLVALGPETVGGRALTTAEAPDLVLPDRTGAPFALRSLRGQKVLLLAWASW